MIEKDSIERLKQIVDIYEVVSSYIELKRAGVNYTACCPFHNEKTPSFVVSPQKGYFKCFGCGVGGDSITFIMEKEHIDYAGAIEKLAYMYNFTLTYSKNDKQDKSINDLLEKITKYYQNKLNSSKNILDYLEKRGILSSSIEKFSLGWSGESYEFIQFLNKENLPFDKLLEIGIIGKNERGYYAKFNSRIMFPIYSPNGKVVGFGGRILSGNIAKYINSQQSKIFNKSSLLYGYNLAKESIFREKKIIITEGYIDTIIMSQAGFNNCVATLGTALTKEHLPLLSKGESEILLCYDGDRAGIEAAFRASILLAHKSGGVVIFKDNKDPADIVKENKIALLMDLLNTPIPFIEFALNHITNKYNINIPLQKEKALKEVLEFFKNLSPIFQDEYRNFIANKLQISPYLIKIRKNKDKQEDLINQKESHQNSFKIAEEIIIKSILEDNSLLEIALEYLNINAFSHNQENFKHLLNGDFSHPNLLGILINPTIKSLNTEDFKEQIRALIINIYTNKLKMIKNDKTLDYATKLESAKEIQLKLNILKNGTLVRV
ncbi:MAG: DNA primase [Helicobacteraceae bacterium]|nr:DNA primase [Helicobacteraceae bacterium]